MNDFDDDLDRDYEDGIAFYLAIAVFAVMTFAAVYVRFFT